MAVRLAHHRRVAIAALFLCFVVGTMLVTLTLGRPGQEADRADRRSSAVVPLGAGITHSVASVAQWDAAVAAAAPGDVLRITSTINSRLVYRGGSDGGAAPGASGTAAAPIVITADPGAWIDPGDQYSNFGALDVLTADHVHVVGVNVRNAQFGIRCLQCNGSALTPVRIAENTVTQIGHSGINFAGHWDTHAPSSYGIIENNIISATGMIQSQFGEGVYVGFGSVEWIDTTNNVVVEGNDISFTGAEGVDIKPGTRHIEVKDNFIHDLAPLSGGAISAHYVNASSNPHPGQLDPVLIEGNRIWNVNLTATAGSNDWAIWVGHGGVDVIDNIIWGLRDNPGSTRAVRVRATQSFGPHPIRIEGNTFWSVHGWVAEGAPSGATNVIAADNIGVDPGSSEVAADTLAFVGPVPALGASGTADSGSGPGSAFALVGAAPDPTTTTTASPATSTTAPSTSTTASTTTTAAPTTTTSPGNPPTTATEDMTTTTVAAAPTTTTPPSTGSSSTVPSSVGPTTTTEPLATIPDSTAVPTTAPPTSAATTTTVLFASDEPAPPLNGLSIPDSTTTTLVWFELGGWDGDSRVWLGPWSGPGGLFASPFGRELSDPRVSVFNPAYANDDRLSDGVGQASGQFEALGTANAAASGSSTSFVDPDSLAYGPSEGSNQRPGPSTDPDPMKALRSSFAAHPDERVPGSAKSALATAETEDNVFRSAPALSDPGIKPTSAPGDDGSGAVGRVGLAAVLMVATVGLGRTLRRRSSVEPRS